MLRGSRSVATTSTTDAPVDPPTDDPPTEDATGSSSRTASDRSDAPASSRPAYSDNSSGALGTTVIDRITRAPSSSVRDAATPR